jgi:hypothetical protein
MEMDNLRLLKADQKVLIEKTLTLWLRLLEIFLMIMSMGEDPESYKEYGVRLYCDGFSL